MARNPERRASLVDAVIDVLATEGARGLTFRAVDAEAGVPAGTTSNYFAARDDLLHQAGTWIHERLAPDPGFVADAMARPRTPELLRLLMHELFDRMMADRNGYLALLELRLAATRRPELAATLTPTMHANLAENIRFHRESSMPGGEDTVLTLYFAMTGLIIEQLTAPGALDGRDPHGLVDRLVDAAMAIG